jgi:hypothetical protein
LQLVCRGGGGHHSVRDGEGGGGSPVVRDHHPVGPGARSRPVLNTPCIPKNIIKIILEGKPTGRRYRMTSSKPVLERERESDQ